MDNLQFKDGQELLQYAHVKGLYKALLVQVKRDFTRANIEIGLDKSLCSNEFVHILRETLYFLLMERFPDYLNLMYAVDIRERAFKDVALTDTVDHADQVGFLLLQRELQKVTTRKNYGSNG